MMRIYPLTLCAFLSFPIVSYAQSGASSPLDSIRAFVQISDHIATSGQIRPEQIRSIKEAGYEVVINLAPARKEMNGSEGFDVISAGLTYIQIPVDFQDPQLRDLEFFFQVMNASKDRKVYVHCFANMRASSFTYLYRIVHQGISPEEAGVALHKVWEPSGAWSGFIERALKTYGR